MVDSDRIQKLEERVKSMEADFEAMRLTILRDRAKAGGLALTYQQHAHDVFWIDEVLKNGIVGRDYMGMKSFIPWANITEVDPPKPPLEPCSEAAHRLHEALHPEAK